MGRCRFALAAAFEVEVRPVPGCRGHAGLPRQGGRVALLQGGEQRRRWHVVRPVEHRHLGGLVGRARDGKVTPAEYSGGTFTVSNLGPFGVDTFIAIVTAPQGGALAVASSEQKAVVVNGEIVIRDRMNITLSADHRITDDGAQYGRLFPGAPTGRPRSSGDRAPPSGGGSAGSNPAGGTTLQARISGPVAVS